MKELKTLALAVAVTSLVLLWVSNPSESNYLREISVEYSKYHDQTKISHEVLRIIGKKKRDNYALFSTYSYKFGRLTFYYFGVAGRIYSLGSKVADEEIPFKSV